MKYDKRREIILTMLDSSESLTIQQLVDALDTSEATVRRDITKMEKKGELLRSWGGVHRVDSPENLRRRTLETRTPGTEHLVVGRIAASQVHDGDTIFVGAGISTLAMVPYIQATGVHAITNAIPQMEALTRAGIQTLLLCGFFKEYSRSLVGVETVQMLQNYRFDASFIGAHGLDEDLNILSGDEREASLKLAAIKNSEKSYLLLDHSKFDRTAFYRTLRQEVGDTYVITDEPGVTSPSWQPVGGGYMSQLKDITRID